MSAERMPQEKSPLLGAPLRGLTVLALRFPVAVTAGAVVLAVLSIVLAAVGLDFHTSRLDLINPESDFNKLWLDYVEEFGSADDVVVVVEGRSRDEVVPVLDEVARALEREERHFRSVLHKIDLATIRSKGLHYASPRDLAALEQFVLETKPIVAGRWTHLGVGSMASAMQGRLIAARSDPSGGASRRLGVEVERLTASLQSAVAAEPRYVSPWPEMPPIAATFSQFSAEYLLADEGRLGFVLLQLVQDEGGGFARGTEAIETLRSLIATIGARHPEVEIGLTGLPVMENDEMRASQADMLEATVLSLVGVVCVFVAGFGGVRHPFLAVVTMLVAMAWSFGYITIAVGHLNILSVSFAVILIGLGIDFGIHFAARYLEYRGGGAGCDAALVRTAASVGPGILSAASTTAVAFFCTGFTQFTGIAELGVVAGGGILLCCLAALGVLPALVHLVDARRGRDALPAPLDTYRFLTPLLRRPAFLLGATGAATLLMAAGAFKLEYDHNLLNLQPEGLESVRLERKLLEESDQSVWFALSLAKDRAEVLERKGRFEGLQSVERVEEIASLIPPDTDLKQPLIERIQTQLEGLPDRPPQIPIQRPQALLQALADLQGPLPAYRKVRGSLRARTCPRPAAANAGVGVFPAGFPSTSITWRATCSGDCARSGRYPIRSPGTGRSAAEPRVAVHWLGRPPPAESLQPRQYLGHGRDGAIRCRRPQRRSPGNRQSPTDFRGIAPDETELPEGRPVCPGRDLRDHLVRFPQPRYAAAGNAAGGAGNAPAFGILGWLNVPLNPANMIVLPLILGIGVDDGIHVVHDYLACRGRYRMSPSTSTSIILTSLTTMVGFGSLMIASHQGLQSLGRVLALGVTCCLFTSLVMLPAILVWIRRDGLPSADESSGEPGLAAAGGDFQDSTPDAVESLPVGTRFESPEERSFPTRRAAPAARAVRDAGVSLRSLPCAKVGHWHCPHSSQDLSPARGPLAEEAFPEALLDTKLEGSKGACRECWGCPTPAGTVTPARFAAARSELPPEAGSSLLGGARRQTESLDST